MSYVQTTRHDRRTARLDSDRAAAQPGAGAFTYLVFALSIGFTAALVLGLVA